MLTLRDELSSGTLRQIERLDGKPAATAEDRWQRRTELLFERLAVRWEIAGLPLEGQKRVAAGATGWRPLRSGGASAESIAQHLRTHSPDLEV